MSFASYEPKPLPELDDFISSIEQYIAEQNERIIADLRKGLDTTQAEETAGRIWGVLEEMRMQRRKLESRQRAATD